MIPGGDTRADLVDAIVARLTAERDALPGYYLIATDWDRGARAGLAQAIDIVTELGEGCYCGGVAACLPCQTRDARRETGEGHA